MATPTVLEQKSKEVIALSDSNQALLDAIEHNNRRRRFWANVASVAILFAISLGIFYQFSLAAQNKKHIDCIIKDLATPPPPGTSPNAKKYISDLATECNIKFTQ